LPVVALPVSKTIALNGVTARRNVIAICPRETVHASAGLFAHPETPASGLLLREVERIFSALLGFPGTPQPDPAKRT
jgi:hypothetical protein